MSVGFVEHIATLLIWASLFCGFVGLGIDLLVKTLIPDGAANDTSENVPTHHGKDAP